MEHAEAYTPSYLPAGGDDYSALCDVWLEVQGQKLPAHSQMLAFHSRFFCRLFSDMKCQNSEIASKPTLVDGKWLVKLDNGVTLEDLQMLLCFVYNNEADVNTMDEAIRLTLVADKYDMPVLLRWSEAKLCEQTSSLTFDQRSGNAKEDWLSAAQCLGVADRLNLKDLQLKCQCSVLKGVSLMTLNTEEGRKELRNALASLEDYGVSWRSLCEVMAVLLCRREDESKKRWQCPKCKAVYNSPGYCPTCGPSQDVVPYSLCEEAYSALLTLKQAGHS